MAVNPREDKVLREIVRNIPELFDHFFVHKKIGEGTYSRVFLASPRYQQNGTYFALKYLLPIVRPSRIIREIRTLRDLNGCQNIIPIHSVFHGNGHVVIVMPVITYHKFSSIYQVSSLKIIRTYMKNLLIAVQQAHQLGIVHRDVKPSNFLFDFRNLKGALVDFGLSQLEDEIDLGIQLSQQNADYLWNGVRSRNNSECSSDSSSNKNQISNKPKPKTGFEHERSYKSRHASSNKHKYVQPTINQQSSSLEIISSSSTILKKIIIPIPDPNNRKDVPLSEYNAKFTDSIKDFKMKMFCYDEDNRQFHLNSMNPELCTCSGKDEICFACYNSLREFYVPRAGTPGFRAPELLLRSSKQNSKIDIWSVGVIFASFLSARYPFLKPLDDIGSLSQVIELFGSDRMLDIAGRMNRKLELYRPIVAMTLRNTIQLLRDSIYKAQPNTVRPIKIPTEAFDLLDGLLDPDPDTRFTAQQALQHPFFDDTLEL